MFYESMLVEERPTIVHYNQILLVVIILSSTQKGREIQLLQSGRSSVHLNLRRVNEPFLYWGSIQLFLMGNSVFSPH